MKISKKLIACFLTLMIVGTSVVGCSSKEESEATSSEAKTEDVLNDAEEEASTTDKVFKIGVNQLVQHDALDASYQGFIDGLKEAGYEEGKNIKIDYQNAQGDQSNANTIATKFVNDKVDLILAIATPSAQAAANATKDIPILVTAVTDPASAKLVATNEAPGGNVSGTSDLTPVKEQMNLLTKLLPEAKKVAMLYSSSEVNSEIQVEMAKEAAKELGLETVDASVSNSNEIQQVVQSLVGKVDAIYAPTDNLIASGMQTVSLVAKPAGIPIICGESGMVDNGGLATYGIDYYNLGKLTAAQAVKIFEGTGTTAQMPIEYLSDSELSVLINGELAKELGITIPDEFKDQVK
ncbi:putative ABC transport system substrate-binding protein [Mobilisporobacter senegalensis]|uniref:Putative ABC transport system substrate-binding protein n=1 Tax=Mobilisporobacter senegalensis TaxID=1329262 RepID=A0A3N1XC62_9FIRM|nr:ABC transporter substrate-binding protein [Mobilisporobacter senegalensis]ROR22347.1 putative ABC transport system substrate-binding protein [Mobilisporobacter senegalensis]